MTQFMHIKYILLIKDKRDDALVGIKSTALKFGDRTYEILSFLNMI